jgi:serine/threonine protein phosphatase PrpC
VRHAQLRGPEHVIFGGIAVVAEGGLGIALSRGGAPKPYAHREPNEDCVGFVWSEWGAALALADGHHGSGAASLAVERALAHAPRWLERAPIALIDRFRADADALVRKVHQEIVKEHASSGSRTTLAVALARPGEGWLGLVSVGDSLLFTCGAAGTHRARGGERSEAAFLGTARMDPADLSAATFVDVRSLRGEQAVVLASDGFSQPGIGVTDPEAAIMEVTRDAERRDPARASLELARGVVQRALDVQRATRSGDNVSAAVLWLGPGGLLDHLASPSVHLPQDPQDGGDQRGDRALPLLRPR